MPPLPQHTHGLYDPRFERDACGVGLVADIGGRKSHEILEKGLEVLVNLAHRGACGCDPLTGDGAGLLIQIPHDFYRVRCAAEGIELPAPGEYGVGMVFLPPDDVHRSACEALVQQAIEAEGQRFLGWRDVPVDSSAIGFIAQESQPRIRQVFVGRGAGVADEAHFERKLYVIRKVVERAVDSMDDETRRHFYIPSLSCNRVVYKGLLMGTQLKGFYRDLTDPAVASAFAMVHARFSTNTLGSWRLAHPYRLICHNGEINTLRGNINWMTARQAMFSSPLFGDDMEKLFPVITPGASDTACFDNTLELLLATGRSLPHALMMMIPEATGERVDVSQEKRDFYEYHSSLMEPWDGPALIAATDGRHIGVVLDRNGLRPFRYLVTKSNTLVMASEVGVLDVPPEEVLFKERIRPGRMFLLDTEEGRIIGDQELKGTLSRRRPYHQWLAENRVDLEQLPEPHALQSVSRDALPSLKRAFGYTLEDLHILMEPMAISGAEAVGSMGNDTPLAVLSEKPQLLFNYFKQLFAQVSNPPLDAIREELVTSLEAFIGSEQNLFEETPEHCHQLKLKEPVLTGAELEKIRNVSVGRIRAATCSMLFDTAEGPGALERAVERLCREASAAVAAGRSIIVLLGPGRGQPLRARSQPACHRCGAPPPDTRGRPNKSRFGGGIRRAAGGHALRVAHRLRRRRSQPVPGLRSAARASRERGFAAARGRLHCGEELHQGHQQGCAQGYVQDGHLHSAELPRRADLRGCGPEPGDYRPLLHLDLLAHWRYWSGHHRGGDAQASRVRLRQWPHVRRAGRRPGRPILLAPRRRVPHVQPGVHRPTPALHRRQ